MLKLFLFSLFLFGCASSSNTSSKITLDGIKSCGCALTCVKEKVSHRRQHINYELYLQMCSK